MSIIPRKFLMIAIAVVVVSTLAVATIVGLQVRFGRDDVHRPHLAVFASGENHQIGPIQYCDPDGIRETVSEFSDMPMDSIEQQTAFNDALAEVCDEPQMPTIIEAAQGDTVQISLPKEMTRNSLRVQALYEPADSEDAFLDTTYGPGDRHSLSIPVNDEEGRVLGGIQLDMPTVFVDNTGAEQLGTFATWIMFVDIAQEPASS
ncbi:DUF2771 family protein [Hoyosella sp. G463]|uniref:DUF2771 family protein n=1 Tax=Lolliginicoccus lacisalsi TaxID=2742202 RepID=A0A927PLW8_9ACTN|nr:DUF2771 family protein [Lolliginicoccus lacisalsi]MBD8505822.1 DUF2771 family protein [Lolliginicoccus lacisalsi]